MRRGPEQYSECDAVGSALRARHRSTAIKRCRRTETFFLLLAWPSLIYSFCRSFLRIDLTDSSSGKYSAGDSERQIDDLDPLVGVDDAFAPDGVEIGEWLFRDGFLGGLSRGLQFLNAIERSDEHVPGFREVRFIAERAMPRNNLGVIVRERKNFVGGGNHAGDFAARTGVDVGIHAVEKHVAYRNHVGLLKMNVDVRIRMRGSKVLEREGFAIGLQLVTGGEGLLRQGLRGRGVEMQAGERAVWSSIQDRQIMRLGHALLGVVVGKDRRSGRVKMGVVIGMVEVPVGIDDVFQRSIAKAIESLFELGPSGRNESVDDEFAIGAIEHYHGSAGAVEHGDIVSKLLRFHGNGVELGAHTRKQVRRRR